MKLKFQPPVVQVALDFATTAEALAVARLAVAAGVDWLEAGTPLIVAQGLAPIGELVRAFPGHPVLADYKTMDSGGKNVERTLAQGAHLMTVCAAAPDETVQAAVAAGRETGVWVVADTIGCQDQAARARQCQEWGVNLVYLHYGADQRRCDPTRDSTQWIDAVQRVVSLPLGVGCFGSEDAVRAVERGVEWVVIGHPLISGPDPAAALAEFVRAVRAAYRPRPVRSPA
jgi:3-hexulose-6-phosphate synthase/6-phospho-3-hexuloisomerase